LEIVEFDVRRLIGDLATMMAPQAQRKGLTLTTEADSMVPTLLRGDPGRLRQVLTNLVGNAVKFTTDGTVSVRVGLIDTGAADGEGDTPATSGREDVRLRFSVRDTGIGIDRQRFHLLFTPFTQLDASTTRQHGGTGLGLAISRQLTELMGGEIGVDSEIGRGSTFWFTTRLGRPLAPDRDAGRDPGIESRPNRDDGEAAGPDLSAWRGIRILLAEDDVINQQVTLGILAKYGLTADVVTTGVEAVAAAGTGDYDLILMDVQMPEMDGLTATRTIQRERRDRPPIPIIAMTAHAMRGDQERCLNAGMCGYVPKPVSRRALIEAITRCMPNGAPPTTNRGSTNRNGARAAE
jgi:CheY-like chemotaxis protein